MNQPRKTSVAIDGNQFRINNQLTYPGRSYNGHRIEGLLMNSRMVQGAFDDSNPDTRALWNYPDGPWDPDRNTAEFIAAMPIWKAHGLAAFTINFQGGSPQGYSKSQPWINSAFTWDGQLRPEYARRLTRILDAADDLGMVAIVGIFYFGQEPRMNGEPALVRACDAATDFLLEGRYTNILVEIANECDIIYRHDIVKPPRSHELIARVQQRSRGKVATDAGRLLVSTSYCGGAIVRPDVAQSGDFLLIHGNGVSDPNRIAAMVRECRQVPGYHNQPILFNEDDHFDFDKPCNNMLSAISEYASWGYFDFRMAGEGYNDGYQSVPVNWGISSPRKRGFFNLLKTVTGA